MKDEVVIEHIGHGVINIYQLEDGNVSDVPIDTCADLSEVEISYEVQGRIVDGEIILQDEDDDLDIVDYMFGDEHDEED